MDRGTDRTSPRYSTPCLAFASLWLTNPSFRMQPSQNERSSSDHQPKPTTTQDGDNDKNINSNSSSNLGPLTSSNLLNIHRGRPIVPTDATSKSPAEPTSILPGIDPIWRSSTSRPATSDTSDCTEHPLLGAHLLRRSRSADPPSVSSFPSSSLLDIVHRPLASLGLRRLESLAEDEELNHPNNLLSGIGDPPPSSTSSRIVGPSRSFGGFSHAASIATTTSSSITGTTTILSPASSASKLDDIFRIHPHATAATSTASATTDTAITDNRSSTTTAAANSKMTPQSPEFDEFAAVPPTDPNITELSSGEVEVAVVVSTSEADQSTSHISLGDVDASRISVGSQAPNHTVVLPNCNADGPVSRNLTDAFESCEGGGVLSTPSSATSAHAGDANNANNANEGEATAGDGSSPAGVEELDIEGLSLSKGSGNAKAKQQHQQKQRSASVLKTPGAASTEQATPGKTCPSPQITVLGETIPFSLHPVLALDLPAPTVNRVSFYCIIHDINKESSDMASHDPCSSADVAGRSRSRSSSLSCSSAAGSVSTISVASSSNNVGEHPVNEEFSPLILAVNGPPSAGVPLAQTVSKLSTATTAASSTLSASSSALIDEEKWLLRAISSRSVSEVENTRGSCPTFAQAIGEQDSVAAADDCSSAGGGGGSQQAPNPMTDLSQSRTQLWKPSRSWWEAKSGKNPWIEPNSHNKRWR